MREDADEIEQRIRQDSRQVEAQLREDAEQLEDQYRHDPRYVRQWLRQNNLIYGGLIAIGVVIVQPFLTGAELDGPATVSVVAFSVATPLLAALIMLNEEETFRRRLATSGFVEVAKAAAQLLAFVGVVAAFWHILWIAGVGILAASAVGLAVHSVGFTNLGHDRA